jgi:hypothetical protein
MCWLLAPAQSAFLRENSLVAPLGGEFLTAMGTDLFGKMIFSSAE